MGNWILDESRLKHMVIEFFRTLYCKEDFSCHAFTVRDRFSILSSDSVNALSRSVTKEEIPMALFDMKPLKVPSPDILHAAFFQLHWEWSPIRCVPW